MPTISAALQNMFEQHINTMYSFDLEPASIEFSRPQHVQHGDLTTPIALQLSKQLGKSPRDIATELLPVVQQCALVEKCEIAGAGYINMWLAPCALMEELENTIRSASPQNIRDEAPVIIEYSQPNIAKPLGIHHILSTVIGQSLVNLHKHLGYNTIAINHLGDWGTQFGKLAVALQTWGDMDDLEHYTLDTYLDLYVRFHEEVEDNPELEDQARAVFKQLEDGDNQLRNFWQTVVDTTMQEVGDIYKRLNVAFDHVHGESFYEDKMQPIIKEGSEKGVFSEGERGAIIAQFDDENTPPAVIVKSDGATLYHTRDLATIDYRVNTWHPKAIYYVVDMAQELYFRQLFDIVDQLKWDLPTLEHVSMGRMRFADKSMSTRKGNIVRLNEVLDLAEKKAAEAIKAHGDAVHTTKPEELAVQIGIGSLIYGTLSQNRKQGMVFDWDRMLSFEGNSAPYIQYSFARTQSILRKAELEAVATDITALEADDRSLILTLLDLPNALQGALEALSPHILANYLYKLCQQFNTFYNNSPILKAAKELQQLRLYLTKLTGDVITCLSQILLVPLPASM